MNTVFLQTAQNFVNESDFALKSGHYLRSWSLTVPARVAFAADAFFNATILPMAAAYACVHAGVMIAIWNADSFIESLRTLDLVINQVFKSAIGALVSTQMGAYLHSTNAQPFEFMLKAIVMAAPNRIRISSSGKVTYGWAFRN